MDNLIDLFHAAVALAPGERAAYLQKVCGADVSLRQTVESLIEHHEQTDNFLDLPAYQAAAQLLTNSETLAAGQMIAHYQILSVLGEGGMGKVYLAEDSKLKRKVALKVLPLLTANDPAARQRLNAAAHNALAYCTWNYLWDAATAEREYKRATELDPSAGHHGYAIQLSELGRHEEAIREIKLAELADPLNSAIKATNLPAMYIVARQYDKAIEQAIYALSLNPTNAAPKYQIIIALTYKAEYAEALSRVPQYLQLAKLSSANSQFLAWVYAMAGRRDEALKILNQYQKSSEPSPFAIALVYSALGERDQTMFWLEKSVTTRNQGLRAIKFSPAFDRVREDPRFQDFLVRVGFRN